MSAPKRIYAVNEILKLLRRAGVGDSTTTIVSTAVGPTFDPVAMAAHQLDGEFHSTADDTTNLDATATEHGLLPKLSGDSGDVLLGDGTWGAGGGGSPTEILDIPTAEMDDTLVLAPDGAGGVEFRAEVGGAVAFVDEETPAGTIDGANAAFTLGATPVAGSLKLYKNGFRQRRGTGNDYTLTGGTITYEAGNIPQTGDIHLADYRS